MTGLVDMALSRARMILAFIALSVAAGLVAYASLPKEGAPNIDIPILFVSVTLPGVSAADSERLLVKPLETELRGLEGVKEMKTFASESGATAILEFDFGWNKAEAIAETRDRVDRAKAEMPAEIEEPSVNEVNLSQFPVVIVLISGQAPERTLTQLAKDLQREIENIPSVMEAPLSGQRDEMLEVLIDPVKLEAYDITAAGLVRVVQSNNRMVAAGELDTGAGRFPVRVPGNFETAGDVLSLPVDINGDRIVSLSDIAEIRRTFEDPEGHARFNGEPTIAIQVKKRIGENIIDTVNTVKQTVAAAQARWPAPLAQAVSIDFTLDQSEGVQSMVTQLESSVLTAVLLVIIVVLAALGLRSALLVGLAVPCSFLLAFALMAAMGMTVSNMVMFGLILAVGMLVDGAIVVAEFAEKRMAEGANAAAAYGEAARRMFWPIISSTATTLCAFLPMLLWPGMPGQFMSKLPITLIFVLSASLLVALIYLPVAGAAFGKVVARAGRAAKKMLTPEEAAAEGRFERIPALKEAAAGAPQAAIEVEPVSDNDSNTVKRPRSLFGRFIDLIVANPIGPFVALAATVAVVIGAFQLYGVYGKGVEFFVKTEPERAIIYVRARGNLSLSQQDQLVREVERRIDGVDGLAAAIAFSGSGGLQLDGGDAPDDAVGQIQIELANWRERLLRPDPLTGDEVMAEIESRTADLPGGYADLFLQKEGPQQGKDIQLRLTGLDWDALNAAAIAAKQRFEGEPGLINIDDTRPLPGIEWRYEVDRAAAGRFGADVEQIGAVVQLATRGALLGAYRPDDSDDELEIRVRFPEESRTLSTLEQLRLRTEAGLAPLSNFVTRSAEARVGSISRVDGDRFFMVRADVAEGGNVNEKIEVLTAWLQKTLPQAAPGIEANFVGDQEEQAKSMAFLGQAFIGALGLMFVILLAQFNSFYNSALVLSAVVMSVAGVLIGMMVTGQTFSIIMTGTGIVALAGIVVNNNIVLIDTFQDYARHMPRLEAITRTAEDRLRPVLLTTITTIAGLTPMMLATSIDFPNREISVGAPTALWWVQLATAVVFGLGFSTLLTLIATPAALAARVWLKRGVLVGAKAAVRKARALAAPARETSQLAKPEDDSAGDGPEKPTRIAAE
ncbi:MAG: efflux RND transporter permease subunit [Rhodobacteraceae bacterium]|nr:efflux RND transporter permease subunit [Paracoccaceae bacterium]